MLVFIICCCVFCFVVPQQIGLDYYTDESCSGIIVASRTFRHNECFNLYYNTFLDFSTTECEVALDCFRDAYKAGDTCPNVSSLTSIDLLSNQDGIHVEANPIEPCGTETLIPIDYEFSECYRSDFYPNCYFKVSYEEDDDETDVIVPFNDNYVTYMELEYYNDESCSGVTLASRLFPSDDCFNLYYGVVDSSIDCNIALECFRNPYENAEVCNQTSALFPTHFLYGNSGIHVEANPIEPCGTETLIPIDYEFGECYESGFYSNCYFKVSREIVYEEQTSSTTPETENTTTNDVSDDSDEVTFISLEYHKDSKCKSKVQAQRYFKHQECFNLFYNAHLDADTDCETSIRCFTNAYNGELECPHASSLNSTHFVHYPKDGIAMLANPYLTCGGFTIIPIEYEFGACYISDFYPGCYFVVTVVGNDNNYDDDDSDELDVYYFSASKGSIIEKTSSMVLIFILLISLFL